MVRGPLNARSSERVGVGFDLIEVRSRDQVIDISASYLGEKVNVISSLTARCFTFKHTVETVRPLRHYEVVIITMITRRSTLRGAAYVFFQRRKSWQLLMRSWRKSA